MKSVISGALLALAACPQPLLADPCHDRFVEIYMRTDQARPTKTFATTEFKGAPAMTNDFLYLSADHHMTVPITPPQPWVLTYQNVMYQSSDKGVSWTKVRDLDTQANAEGAQEVKRASAETIRNAACATEDLAGVAHERLEADLTLTQGMKTENHYTYWVRRDTGFVSKAIYDTKGDNFEMTITQQIEPAPDLQLPLPK